MSQDFENQTGDRTVVSGVRWGFDSLRGTTGRTGLKHSRAGFLWFNCDWF